MSSQSAFKQNKTSKYYRTPEMVSAKKVRDAKKLETAKNHVSEDVTSPNGHTHHFKGPKKRDLTPAEKHARNVMKRVRKGE